MGARVIPFGEGRGAVRDAGAHPRCGRGAVHGARLRGHQPAADHGGGGRQSRGRQLSLRQQGRAVPGRADAAARPDEPGTRRACSTASRPRPRPRRCRATGSWRRCSFPALRLARDPERGGTNFLRLLGRAYADPAPFIRQFLSEQYASMIARFKAAFGRALPQLPRKELSWRLHFIMGALSYTLAGTDALKIITELNPLESDNDEILLRRLAPFLLAGLNAPLPDLSDVTRELDARAGAHALNAPLRFGRPAPARRPPRSERTRTMLTALWIRRRCAHAAGARLRQCVGPRLGRRDRRRAARVVGHAARCRSLLNVLLTAAFVVLAIALAVPTLRRKLISDAVLGAYRKVMPRDVADRARRARGRHRVVGRRTLLGPPELAAAARHAAAGAHRRGTALPRRGNRGAVRDDQRLGDHQRLQGPAAARVAVHQGQGFPRHDHSEGVRRPRASPRGRMRRW